jgi:hypothetical protein
MNNKLDQDTSQVSDQLHPFVYAALAGLAFCLIVSAWIFFSQGGYLELDLGVVSALVFMTIAIPTVLHFVERGFHADRASEIGRLFRTWITGDFDMKQGRSDAQCLFSEPNNPATTKPTRQHSSNSASATLSVIADIAIPIAS